ncbi:hypothetical protein HPB51_005279 [Rhipicephalus microplus]|uniref:Ig-like domain-containing protein n=1 Tax=Rhipicephalus microplus TaxID=6941 RepID=A0A9J6DFY6_RHIMP|nr:hypothetical protein HPB51_005279 [Rhipicephalus microplus]
MTYAETVTENAGEINEKDEAQLKTVEGRATDRRWTDTVRDRIHRVSGQSLFRPKDQTGKSRGFDEEDLLDVRQSPRDASLRYRESHIFRCVPAHPQYTSTTWFKEDEELRIFMQDPNLEGLILVGNNTLWVREMDVSLRGNYTCRVSSGSAVRDLHFKISYAGPAIVKPPCEIVQRKVPQDTSFTRGETVILPCETSGSHVATHWTRNGAQLRTGVDRVTILPIGFLTINDSRPEDSGVYACVATDVAKNCSRSFSAAVAVMPKSRLQEGQHLSLPPPAANYSSPLRQKRPEK